MIHYWILILLGSNLQETVDRNVITVASVTCNINAVSGHLLKQSLRMMAKKKSLVHEQIGFWYQSQTFPTMNHVKEQAAMVMHKSLLPCQETDNTGSIVAVLF